MDWGENLATYLGNVRDVVLDKLRDRDTDIAKGLDPAVVTVTNPITNFVRWNSANRKHEKFNGTSWVALVDYFDIEIKAFTGDVTKPAGSSVLTIAANAVTNAHLRNSGAVSVIGRSANSSGDPADIAAAANDTFLQRVGNALTWAGLTIGMIANALITYAKIQNVTATDRLLGRATAGAGVIEEIACTAAGRALLDDASATVQRTTLGLGTLATQSGTFSGTSSGTNTGDEPAASTTAAGTVELATAAEIRIGTDVTRAVSPLVLLNALGFSNFDTSTDRVITAGGLVTVTHSLGRTPSLIQLALVNQTAEGNWAIGNVVYIPVGDMGGNTGTAVYSDATNVYIRIGSAASSFSLLDKTLGNIFGITNANWKLRIFSWA